MLQVSRHPGLSVSAQLTPVLTPYWAHNGHGPPAHTCTRMSQCALIFKGPFHRRHTVGCGAEMTAAPVSANPQTWPAPPSAAVALLLIFLALIFVASAVASSPRRRREEPLRTEIQARPVVTFRVRVDVRAKNFLGTMLSQRGPLYLVVCGDAFEVSHPFPLARFLFGQDYCYRAEDTTVRVVPGPRHDWIEISGQPIMSAAQIEIGRRDMNRQIWDALVRAGAHPIGSFPLL